MAIIRTISSPMTAEEEGSKIFLSGPFSPAPSWDRKAREEFLRHTDSIIILPRFMPWERRSKRKQLIGKHREWRQKHLLLAAADGLLFFWFPIRTDAIAHESFEQSKAELYQAVRFARNSGTKVVIGIEPYHPNRKELKMIAAGFHIFTTFEEACEAAINKINSKKSIH